MTVASFDPVAVQLALRNRALTLATATTGLATLSATATGYARAAGSFVTDRFVVGMEIVPSGFAANPVDLIIGVTASTLTTRNGRGAEAAAGNRSMTVGLPTARNWESSVNPFIPSPLAPYLDEEFSDGPRSTTGSRNGGEVESLGMYYLKWFNPVTVGNIPAVGTVALRQAVNDLLLLFQSGTTLAAGSSFVSVRGDTGPYAGQIIPLMGWNGLVLTIPWRVRTRSVIAA